MSWRRFCALVGGLSAESQTCARLRRGTTSAEDGAWAALSNMKEG